MSLPPNYLSEFRCGASSYLLQQRTRCSTRANFNLLRETRSSAAMADQSLPLHLNTQQQRIVVAIGLRRDHPQPVSRSFSLHPKLSPCPAEECHVARIERAL